MSEEDALRYAVWLMHYSDAAMLARYAYDRTNLVSGIRIVERRHEIRDDDQRLMIPQLIIANSFLDERWKWETCGRGRKFIAVTASHLFHYDTRFAVADMDDLLREPTYDMVLKRTEEIFMRGTLYLDAWAAYINGTAPTTNEGRIIDPRSVLFTEETAPDPSLVGTYVPTTVKNLSEKPPVDIQRVGDVIWRTRKVIKPEDVEPERDYAVLYGLKATYDVSITLPS